MNMNIIN